MKALFLDRDGVINIEKEGSYILHPGELQYYPGALNAIARAAAHFEKILVVTNQRGIGKGLMTEEDLHAVHAQISADLQALGGRIDKYYFAPALESEHPMRKPNTGMGELALQDFPLIDCAQSVMIGNNISDMQFGKNMGMHTVFLHSTQAQLQLPHPLIDEQFASLAEWIESLS